MISSYAVDLGYILPIKASRAETAADFAEYLRWLSSVLKEVIVVDGSSAEIFRAHAASWGSFVRHVAPLPDLTTPMGKVGNVLTGIELATCERLIIADDDVRYDDASLARVAMALNEAHVVRPQNYFDPMPWHARWDTARMLLNRATGGDWPGTLGVRRSILRATGGYDGNAMFENLELVRTVVAAGGRESVLLDAYTPRRPASTRHFWSQRIRQAYDEFARPVRLVWQLSLLPLTLVLALGGHWFLLVEFCVAAIALAELGRRRAGGARFFPASAPLFAPAWLAERAVCSWLALLSRIAFGGVRYRGRVLSLAANPLRVLRQRHESAIGFSSLRDRTPRYRSA